MRSGRPRTIRTPRIAVNEMDEAISSAVAPMTGVTAAMAELPQIELPQAIKMESRNGNFSIRLRARVAPNVTKTVSTTVPINSKPESAIIPKLIEAPSSRTATSSSG